MSDAASYDIVAVGTGFATSFFLHRLLSRSPQPLRVLVLESGVKTLHSAMLENVAASRNRQMTAATMFHNASPDKWWNFTCGFGGSSVCWRACTPRMLPEDFALKSTYGVGVDWPLSYDQLEPYYCEAEELMAVSGSNEKPGPWRMSRPYPQQPHEYSNAAKLFKKAFPESFFPQATARNREICCGSNVCGLCPVDAKFTIENGMSQLYADHRVALRCNSKVTRFDYAGNTVKSITFFDTVRCEEQQVRGDLVVLGANGLFNPHIMLSSGLDDPGLGKGLVESATVPVDVEFEHFQNFQGSTLIAGQGFMLYAGKHRRKRAGALMHVDNRVKVSAERGRWLTRMRLLFTFEDLRSTNNRVISTDNKPTVVFNGRSAYCTRGITHLQDDVSKILQSLGVGIRHFSVGDVWRTDSHIQGTHVMGNDRESSVVDQGSVHHRLRNLVVVGGGVFPTAPPANPTLTICALALMAADKIT